MKTETENEIVNAAHGKAGGGEHVDKQTGHGSTDQKSPYYVEIEGLEYPWNTATITVTEIRVLGSLPADQPVIEVDPDNQERTLAEGEIVQLKPGHRYGKKVRYKRGLQDRLQAELALLRRFFPTAQWHPSGAGGWVLIHHYKFPSPIWNRMTDTVCFEVPVGYPGQAPYGFYVAAGLRLQQNGAMPQSYQESVSTPFDGSWGKFSWAHAGTWRPTADISSGSNLTNFVFTFADRLREVS